MLSCLSQEPPVLWSSLGLELTISQGMQEGKRLPMVVMATGCALHCPMLAHTWRTMNPVSLQQCGPWTTDFFYEEATEPCLPDPLPQAPGQKQRRVVSFSPTTALRPGAPASAPWSDSSMGGSSLSAGTSSLLWLGIVVASHVETTGLPLSYGASAEKLWSRWL